MKKKIGIALAILVILFYVLCVCRTSFESMRWDTPLGLWNLLTFQCVPGGGNGDDVCDTRPRCPDSTPKDLAEWKQYRNTSYGFDLRHPEGYVIHEFADHIEVVDSLSSNNSIVITQISEPLSEIIKNAYADPNFVPWSTNVESIAGRTDAVIRYYPDETHWQQLYAFGRINKQTTKNPQLAIESLKAEAKAIIPLYEHWKGNEECVAPKPIVQYIMDTFVTYQNR